MTAVFNDMIGRRFGSLFVSTAVRPRRYGGRMMRFWECVCDCGNTRTVAHGKLIDETVTACEVCARGPCVVCGGPIVTKTRKNVCSSPCFQEKKRRIQIACYARRSADPEFNRARYISQKQRLELDPVRAERERDMARRRNARYRSDTTVYERQLAQNAEWYERNRDAVLERRRERIARLSPEECLAYEERIRKYQRQWKTEWRHRLASDPEQYEIFLEHQRESQRKHAAKRGLASLVSIGSALGERLNDD